MKIKIQLIVLLICMVTLTACSIFSPVKLPPENSYMLTAVPTDLSNRPMHPLTLLVMPPETEAAYHTTQMAYTIKPYQIAYFQQNRWAETPSQMFFMLLTQSLSRTHYYRSVVTPPYVGPYDYILKTNILKLQQNYMYHSALVELTVQATLIQASTNQVVADKQFSITVPMRMRSPYGGVIAANSATKQLLKNIVLFSVRNSK
ncbi:MAG: hypothetical protein A3F12_04820 [Gammaproteobacteria bacterium RIFCSPHIGHO2_12_FULL_38_14]|nr:MAG: hypothetical protein A3F12_04820 [Gammaproteobacteria bacterium RIFCSPHIGHO2_12_FULL_38_14]